MTPLSRRSFLSTTAVAGALSAAAGAAPAVALPWQPKSLERPLPLAETSTPALIVDIDQVEANLKTMADYLKARGMGLRPHTKTHKCPYLAHRQMALGAVGVCCAKVSEAEVMAASGLTEILITSPVVTREKIDRVIALAKNCTGLQIVIDQAQNATDFDAAARAAGIRLGVLIDLESGTRRTGVPMGDAAAALARHIAPLKHLRLDGIQCYGGHVMHIGDFESRKAASLSMLAEARDTRLRIEADGIPLRNFTGGGTGTYDIDVAVEGMTDLQCGSYLVMDLQYGILGAPEGRIYDTFPQAMFVWSTAISQPVPGSMTIDAGLKAMYRDSPRPELRGITGVTYGIGGDEHGILSLENPSRPIRLGDKLALLPSHCDPTINLYDHFHACRNDRVEALWPISARGMSQ
ncbi:MAG: DSD1 family PLP-dependent enzyme [Candidatus Hydrogenedentes bacterium]|nr:DSD1 family PLP-dependent enzyme [Candidatus Hydrogenedentota bacterium]